MTFAGTALLYLLIGVAVGLLLARQKRRRDFVLGLLFWPFYAPFLLQPEDRVQRALRSLDGLASDLLAPELARVRGLQGALDAMSRRIAEMDALLEGPELNEPLARTALDDLARRGVPESDPRQQSVRARLRNIERLRAMRDRTRADLERILLKLDEMKSQLLLLKFAGRPEDELVRAVKEIAQSVEEIAEGLLAEEPMTAV